MQEAKTMQNTTNNDWILAALAGEPDMLSPVIEKDTRYLRSLSCPKCGSGGIIRKTDTLRPFASHDVLAKWNGLCPECQCLFSPTTGVIIAG
jgi:hypothetical protein